MKNDQVMMIPSGSMNPAAISGKPGTLMQIESDRAVQEVQAAVMMAKRFPRDEIAAQTRIIQSCKRQSLAESAMYAYKKGTGTITGPSIRLAEVMAQAWGNLDYGVEELQRFEGESIAQAYCWDLETNVKRRIKFQVPHEMKAGGSIKKLTDPRDIYEHIANMGARRLRACILGSIPGDISEAAIDQCEQTLKGGKEPLIDRIKKMVSAFLEQGVDQKAIEKRLGHKVEATIEKELIELQKVFRSIKDGHAGREEFFEIQKPVDEDAAARILGDAPKLG